MSYARDFESTETEAYAALIYLSMKQGKVKRVFLVGTLSELRKDLLAVSGGNAGRPAVMNALLRYLRVLDFFEKRGDTNLIRNVIDRLYPAREVHFGDALTQGLIGDLLIAQYLRKRMDLPGLRFDLGKFHGLLETGWRKKGYFHLADCEGACELKSIHRVLFLDAECGCVPEKYFRGMFRYLRDSFRRDNALMARDPVEFLRQAVSPEPCDEFCRMDYWQKLWCLKYLIFRLDPDDRARLGGPRTLSLCSQADAASPWVRSHQARPDSGRVSIGS